MPNMNKKPGLKARIAWALSFLPTPVALFILDRIVRPLVIIMCALLMGVVFPVFMLAIILLAPFNPPAADRVFRHIMGSLEK